MSVPPPPAPGQQGGQPGPYGPPPVGAPVQFGDPGQQQPPKKRRLFLKIGLPILIVVVLGAIGLGVVVFQALKDSPFTAQAGDCMNITEFKQIDANNMPKQIGCDDPTANVKVAVRLDSSTASCPAKGYEELTLLKPSAKLCMIINVKTGDCVANFGTGDKGYKKVACTDPTAEVEFVKVESAVNENVCEGTEGGKFVTYPTPPTSLCWKAASK
ncbi:hypothetical protein [Amycolatopsis sp. NPDC059657]|uniref:LppU/SCO3897 family protein n=1 Tax=Amycolatopsis sp. NPDC059657 TaxID=3346899 RepID=UPI00366A9821